MKNQILDEVKKDIENDLEEIELEHGTIECDISAMKEHQKFTSEQMVVIAMYQQ